MGVQAMKRQIILNQNRARFGQSSEKQTYILSGGQRKKFQKTLLPQLRKRFLWRHTHASRSAPWKSSRRICLKKLSSFCDTQAGANASVVIFTTLETAKANGLNSEAWLDHILTVLPDRFAML